ncbi:MAG: metallophosphoesterase [Oscillospiraceae bacterium]|nr:metallophosphoesterase [Oscillospiraceae bacterium]
MALYVIGDLHLSSLGKKPMDIFMGWENHTEKLIANWNDSVKSCDAVVIAGDISWGMTLQESLPDFQLLHSLPGTKILIKGNHDYWWTSAGKMQSFFLEHGLSTLSVLHNNAYAFDGFAVCGSRGWIFENGQPRDEKIINRERFRIEASIVASEKLDGEKLLFLHYPPVFMGHEIPAYLDLMRKYGIKRCFYGHLHGADHKRAVKGPYKNIEFSLISADYLKFSPFKIT